MLSAEGRRLGRSADAESTPFMDQTTLGELERTRNSASKALARRAASAHISVIIITVISITLLEVSMFVGRERELAALKKELEAPRPSLLIVYGRRRVGKSRLIQEAVAGRRAVYFQASRETTLLNLESFKRDIAATLGEDPVLVGLSTWSITSAATGPLDDTSLSPVCSAKARSVASSASVSAK